MKTVPLENRAQTDEREARSPGNLDRRAATLKGLWASSIGNAMEWFDWTCYAMFAAYLARNMFDKAHDLSALLNTLAVFAVGFVARPIGGAVFGKLADARGRRFVMVTTTTVMALGSLLIGLAPTYAQVGVLSSMILVIARLAQGLAHGGESAASYVYISEIAPDRSRGLWSSVIYVSVSLGALCATGLGALLTNTLSAGQMQAWGWRVPFLIGSLLGVYAYFMRRGLVESEVYEDDKRAQQAARRTPVVPATRAATFSTGLRLVVLTGGATITYYTWSAFASTYAITVKGMAAGDAFTASLGAQFIGLLALPICGALSDRIGRRPLCIAFGAGFIVCAFPLNGLLSNHAWTLFVAQSIALILWAMVTSIYPALMAEQLPTRSRAASIGIISSLAVALFGGTAPYLTTLLASQGVHYLFTLYMMALCLATLVVAWRMPETKGISLSKV